MKKEYMHKWNRSIDYNHDYLMSIDKTWLRMGPISSAEELVRKEVKNKYLAHQYLNKGNYIAKIKSSILTIN